MSARNINSLLTKREDIKTKIECSFGRVSPEASEEKTVRYCTKINKWLDQLIVVEARLFELQESGKEKEAFFNECEDFEEDVLRRIKQLTNEFDPSFLDDSLDCSHPKSRQNRGSNLIQPKIDCPSFGGGSKDNKFAFRDFFSRFEFCAKGLDSNADRLIFLKAKLTGIPFKEIHHLEETNENYKRALQILKEKYLNPYEIREAVFSRIVDYRPKNEEDLEGVRDFLVNIKYELEELDTAFGYNLTQPAMSGDMVLSFLLFRKLPNELRKELMTKTGCNYPDLKAILEMTPDIATTLLRTTRMPFSSKKEGPPPRFKSKATKFEGSKFKSPATLSSYQTYENKGGPPCPFCGIRGHKGSNCFRFPNYITRRKRCEEIGLCAKCTSSNHLQAKCEESLKSKFPVCSTCNSRDHLLIMCPNANISTAGSSKVLINYGLGDQYLMPVVRVNLETPNGCVLVPCLIDTGSQRSFFSEKLMVDLKIPGELTKEISMEVHAFLSSECRAFKQANIGVRIAPWCCVTTQVLFSNVAIDCWTPDLHMILDNLKKDGYPIDKGLQPHHFKEIVGILGTDLIQFLNPMKMVTCMEGQAWHVGGKYVPFGNRWGFHNKTQALQAAEAEALMNFDTVIKVIPPVRATRVYHALNPVPSYVDPFGDRFSDSQVDRGLESIFSVESLGISSEDITEEEIKKVEEFKRAITMKDGHYEIELPWEHAKLKSVASNYPIALKIMEHVEKNLRKKGKYEEYLEEFKKQETEGIIEEITVSPSEFHKYKWIPHRPVYREGEGCTTKIRPVFNASLKGRAEMSLNEAAFPGVNLTQNMLQLLLHFRKNKFILLGDIRKAFLMIRLKTEEDKNRFCFFLKVGDDLKCYRYNTILFGFITSPFILNFVLQHHAKKYPKDECSQMLIDNFYVDNLIKTCNNEEQLESLYSEAVPRLKEGGFELRSCTSNSSCLRERMQTDGTLINPESKSLKVLGYEFEPESGKFSVAAFSDSTESRTKRSILANSSRLFDPLSLCAPVTIRGRLLVRDLWKLGVSWDETVPEDLSDQWENLSKDFEKLNSLEFDRMVVEEKKPAKLVIFCDASAKAYGFAAYVIQDCHSTLFFAKTKVAPLIARSLPTLELLSTFLALKCLSSLLSALEGVELTNIFLCVDAQIVLTWILDKNPGKANVFVKNRVNEISKMLTELKGTFNLPIDFRYVPTKENPADLLTRGLTFKQFKRNLTFWTCGPEWLQHETITWPVSELECLKPCTKLTVQAVVMPTQMEPSIESLFDLERFSSFAKLINVAKMVFSFILRTRRKDEDPHEMAVRYLLKIMQQQEYAEELAFLKQPSGRIPGRVNSLALFLDNDGLIRSRGRIGSCEAFGFEVACPILLARDSQLTRLITRDCHVQSSHLGVDSTISMIRLSGYWIPRIRSVVKGTVKSCTVCKRYNYGPYRSPNVPDLPKHRVNFVRPFLQTGIDFAGPQRVAGDDERESKMYFLVFTCLAIRAVHIELLSDMSVHSFVLAFVRFVNRYGIPSHIYSDNAKSFLAAGDLLQRALVSEEFSDQFGRYNMRHITIPVHSPWYGGMWERMIKTVKTCLHKTLGRVRPRYFDLLTILSDVQRAVNDRPLTYRCSEDRGLEVISPRLFLGTCPNPYLVIRADTVSAGVADPPYRRDLVRSLTMRDETLARFRKLWYERYLLSLREQSREPLRAPSMNLIGVGEVVLVKLPNKSRPYWLLGKILDLHPGSDGLVRSALVLRGDGTTQTHSLKHLFPLELSQEQNDGLNEEAALQPVMPGDLSETSAESTDGEEEEPFQMNDSTFREMDEQERTVQAEPFEMLCSECGDHKNELPSITCGTCERLMHIACVENFCHPVEGEAWHCRECLNKFDCPVCMQPWRGRNVILCDHCEKWFHFRCVRLETAPPEDQEWVCDPCRIRHRTSLRCLGLSEGSVSHKAPS